MLNTNNIIHFKYATVISFKGHKYPTKQINFGHTTKVRNATYFFLTFKILFTIIFVPL